MSYATEILADSPSMYWPLDETTGNTATDVSGNNRHGQHLNSPTLGGTSLLGDGSGKSITYNGSNQLTFIASASWMDQAQFTVTIRFKPTSGNISSTVYLASRWQSSGTAKTFILYAVSGKLTGSTTIGATQKDVTGATTMVAGNTYTLAIRYNNTTLDVFLNGVLDGTLAVTGTPFYGTGGQIEVARVAAALYSAVNVDEFVFNPTALSDARLLTQHNAAIASAATLAGSATLTESSTLTVTGVREQPAAVTMAETSSLTIAGTRVQTATVTMTETSAMTTVAVITTSTSVTMIETSSLTSSAGVISDTTSAMTEISSLTIVALREQLATVMMTETSSLNVSADVAQVTTEVWGMIFI